MTPYFWCGAGNPTTETFLRLADALGENFTLVPKLIELPRIVPLDHPPVTMLGYPLAMVLAEKIVTAIDRVEGNANVPW